MPPRKVSWTEENMEAAKQAVISGLLTYLKASRTYQIPCRTLRDHVKRSIKKAEDKTNTPPESHLDESKKDKPNKEKISATVPTKKVSWTQKTMDLAVDAVIKGFLSHTAASKTYDIPCRTLRDHVKKKLSKKAVDHSSDEENIEEIEKRKPSPVDNEDTNTSWFNLPSAWYCHACKVDRIADMRQCVKCLKWYHEACVGLTADDLDPFECPIGCDEIC